MINPFKNARPEGRAMRQATPTGLLFAAMCLLLYAIL
jgi:hypothetical protein